MTSRTPFVKLNMHKWRNKRHFPKAMLFTHVPLLPSPFLGGWAPNTLSPNIQTIHAEQMPLASD